MIYLVIFLLAVIILLLFFILRLKSKETFVLDNSSNKPKIDNYNLDNYS
jgi:type IV secretory pathway component VirB8